MDIESCIKKSKELYTFILNFLESENNSEREFLSFTKVFDKQDILNNRNLFLNLLRLLYFIGDNYHRTSDFLIKLGQIFQYLAKDNQMPISNSDIFDIYKTNKRLLLFLFEQKFIIPDETILKLIMKNKDANGYKFYYYLYPEIKKYLGKRKIKHIEYEIQQKFKVNLDTFENAVKKVKIIHLFVL